MFTPSFLLHDLFNRYSGRLNARLCTIQENQHKVWNVIGKPVNERGSVTRAEAVERLTETSLESKKQAEQPNAQGKL